MISKNITTLRKQFGWSQEAIAEKVEVSRQTYAKWESGESVPDIRHCSRLAELFEVSLDDLVNYTSQEEGDLGLPPKGKYAFGTVTVGDKGQIVVPVKARRVFNIKPGDSLVVLGDINQGLALLPADLFLEVFQKMQDTKEEK